ncbi:MAG: 7-carboxy-7-deazaguanine synthase QueE [Flavobacteriales bacterium]|nr:7-carboxy-7-deazaguanine synthase QueE [Flavobacteriales bacterium]
MEHFYTIQGEGSNTGRAAYFIRLGGCDVGCVWCDVKESWDIEPHPKMTLDEILEEVLEFGAKLCVITGGEPALFNLEPLTALLRNNGIETAIETSGTRELTGKWDTVCFSPKKFKLPVESIYKQANELKVIVYHPSDLQWADEHAEKVNSNCLLYLQPEWSREEEMLPIIIDHVKRSPRWRISLQTHKYMNIP